MGRSFNNKVIEIHKEDFDILQKLSNIKKISKRDIFKEIINEYCTNHPIDDNADIWEKTKKRTNSIYRDETLLNRIEIASNKYNWNRSTFVEFSLRNYIEKAKLMSVKERDEKLEGVYKNASMGVTVDSSLYYSLKDWCEENDESRLRITTIAVLLQLEEEEQNKN